jgi:hypothetical protein
MGHPAPQEADAEANLDEDEVHLSQAAAAAELRRKTVGASRGGSKAASHAGSDSDD